MGTGRAGPVREGLRRSWWGWRWRAIATIVAGITIAACGSPTVDDPGLELQSLEIGMAASADEWATDAAIRGDTLLVSLIVRGSAPECLDVRPSGVRESPTEFTVTLTLDTERVLTCGSPSVVYSRISMAFLGAAAQADSAALALVWHPEATELTERAGLSLAQRRWAVPIDRGRR